MVVSLKNELNITKSQLGKLINPKPNSNLCNACGKLLDNETEELDQYRE